jgi:hypothetical protein
MKKAISAKFGEPDTDERYVLTDVRDETKASV